MNDYMKAVTYRFPEHIPVKVGLLPATWAKYGKDLQKLCLKHPNIFQNVANTEEVRYFTPPSYHAGKFTDAWGCVWENINEGYESIVTGHPVPNREDVWNLKVPEEDIGTPHGFMYLRLLDLRGFEEMMVDFAEEPEELQHLIDIVRDYNIRQTEINVKNSPDQDLIVFGDDNGLQHSLPIRPETWRKYIKPAYNAIFDVVHKADKLVYMHTDGCIWQVIPDFTEIGVNVINPQIRANGLGHLVDTCKGKVCIDLDLDRQLFPFATPKQIESHIEECVKALYMPEGGLMLSAECAADVPFEIIEAICDTFEKVRNYKG
ncbi:MAG: hypothetical protein IJD86_06845 [Clostridia bacterium]|nr:hypothetical protein [Clostridia bacterium]